MDAITILEKDHRKVESLFERYRSASDARKAAIVRDITRELSAHMDAEERELYPVLRTAIEDGPDLMEDAVKEHKEARGLLAELAKVEDGSFDMDAKVATLRKAIDHHVKDEEEEIFPKTRHTLDSARLAEIGARIEKAKAVAPKKPPASAAQNSPGASLGGIVSAASDRVKNLISPSKRAPQRTAAAKAKKARGGSSSTSRTRKTAAKTRTRVGAAKTTQKKRAAARKSR